MSVESETRRALFYTLPMSEDYFADLKAPTLPSSLRNSKGDLTEEQEWDYHAFCIARDDWSTKQAMREVAFAEEELFPEVNLSAWVKRDLWTVEQFVALSLEALPLDLETDLIEELRNTLPRAFDYMQRLELANLAVEAGLIKIRDCPMKFVEWAKSKELRLPPELDALCQQASGFHVPDQPKVIDPDVERITRERDELREMVTAQSAEMVVLKKKRASNPRSETRDILIAGMAFALDFDPKQQRNSKAMSSIKNGIRRTGHELDDQTILNAIRTALEICLPR